MEGPGEILDTEWMVKGPKVKNHTLLSFKDKVYKLSLLNLFQFFRNYDKTRSSNSSVITDRVEKEIVKYWERSNILTQTDWWVKRNILTLNTEEGTDTWEQGT